MQTTAVSSSQQAPLPPTTEVDDGYAEFLAAITAKFAEVKPGTPLFTTSLTDIAIRGDTCWNAVKANPKGKLPRGSVDGGNWVGFRTFRPVRLGASK